MDRRRPTPKFDNRRHLHDADLDEAKEMGRDARRQARAMLDNPFRDTMLRQHFEAGWLAEDKALRTGDDDDEPF
jgi:hypothetical protein